MFANHEHLRCDCAVAYDAASEAYRDKLHPEDDQLETEMEYWATGETATKAVLTHAQTQLQVAKAPADVAEEAPDTTASIWNLKAEMVERKDVVEEEVSSVECLITYSEQISSQSTIEDRRIIHKWEVTGPVVENAASCIQDAGPKSSSRAEIGKTSKSEP